MSRIPQPGSGLPKPKASGIAKPKAKKSSTCMPETCPKSPGPSSTQRSLLPPGSISGQTTQILSVKPVSQIQPPSRIGGIRPPGGIPAPSFQRQPSSLQSQPTPAASGLRPPGGGLRPPGGREAARPVTLQRQTSSIQPPAVSIVPPTPQTGPTPIAMSTGIGGGLVPPSSGAPSRKSGLKPPSAIARPPSMQRQKSALKPPQKAISATISVVSVDETGSALHQTTSKSIKAPADRQIPVPMPEAPKIPAPAGLKPKRSLKPPGKKIAITTGLPPPPKTQLEEHVSKKMQEAITDVKVRTQMPPSGPIQVAGRETYTSAAPTVTTEEGEIPAHEKITLKKTIERTKTGELISHHLEGVRSKQGGQAGTTLEIAVEQLQPSGALPLDSDAPGREAVSVISEVAVGLDNKRYIKTSVALEREAGDGLNPEEVAKLVQEEIEDVERVEQLPIPEIKTTVESTYGIRKKIEELQMSAPDMREVLLPALDIVKQELAPENLAALMHNEEKGLSMEEAPEVVYNFLFPEDKDEQYVEISSAAPAPLQDVVVPTLSPPRLIEAMHIPELEQAAIANRTAADLQPLDNIYSTTVVEPAGGLTTYVAQKKKKSLVKKKVPLLIDEPAPWKDYQSAINLVGAAPSAHITSHHIDLSGIDQTFEENGLEFMLVPECPRYVSRVQLRGTQKPTWFPGYLTAFPDVQEIVKIAKSPSGVLLTAWRAVQPNLFPDNTFSSI